MGEKIKLADKTCGRGDEEQACGDIEKALVVGMTSM